MRRDFLDLPPPPPPPAPRDSLHHFNFASGAVRIKKSWLATALISGAMAAAGWAWTTMPLLLSWERHQITDEQLGHALYDTLDPKTKKRAETVAKFDEATLPPEGVVTRLLTLEESKTKLAADLAAATKELAALRLLIVDQYMWRVRISAASSEPDARKRKDSSDKAEAKYKRCVAAEKETLDACYRLALERNPYE